MIVRTPNRDRFTIIDKRALEDDRLSWRARGLLAYLLSKPVVRRDEVLLPVVREESRPRRLSSRGRAGPSRARSRALRARTAPRSR